MIGYEILSSYNYPNRVICEILINADIHNLAHHGIVRCHTPEACPLNNPVNRKLVIEMSEKLAELAQENHVELKEQFHFALEHNFVWIVDAENGHTVQKFLIG
jgi:hypothetical protein